MNKSANQNKPNPFLGPFNMQNYNKNIWEDIKQKILLRNSSTIEDKKEKLSNWQIVLQLLFEVNECPDYKQYFGDVLIKNFFFKDIFFPIFRSLLNQDLEKDDDNPTSYSCLLQILILWTKTLDEDHSHLQKIARMILNPVSKYYQQNKYSSFQEHISSEPVPQHLTWLESLRIGDVIDCVKCEPKYKKMSWSHARIDEITEFSIKVSFLGDNENATKEFNKKANAHEMAPYKSKCSDFDRRMNLKKGDELYVFWKKKIWTLATVMDTQESLLEDKKHSINKVKIGYRVYSQEGKKMDAEKRRYTGWSAKKDEWFCSTDPRLCLNHQDHSQFETICDDSNDMMIQSLKGKRIYAITRSNYCDSNLFIRLMNDFGEKGGFERIVQRILNKENWAPIKTVYRLCSLIGNLTQILHREFALEYIPNLKEAVWRNILESPKLNVENYTNFKINKILNAFIKLLGRIYSPSERKEIIVEFKFQVCSVCLECQHLPVQLQGLKMISKFIRIIEPNTPKNFWSSSNSELNDFLIKSKILLKICFFDDNDNTKLAKMFESIVKYMEENGLIDPKDFKELCFAILEGNKESRLIFYKLFSKICFSLMEPICRVSFIENVCRMSTKDIIEEDMKFLCDLLTSSEVGTIVSRKLNKFCWEFISVENSAAPIICQHALFIFLKTIKNINLTGKEVCALIEDCMKNVQKNISVSQSLKIFIDLLLYHHSSEMELHVKYLWEEKDLFGLLIQNFKEFKSNLKLKIQANPKYSETDLDSLIDDGLPYNEHVGIRIEVLRYLAKMASIKEKCPSYKLFCDIWDAFISESLTARERSSAYSILSYILNSTNPDFEKQGIVKFFREKMGHNFLLRFEDILIADLEFFKTVFLGVNRILGRITFKPQLFGQVTLPNSICVIPNEIEGIDILWDFICLPENNNIAQNAMDLLDLLCLNLNDKLISQLQEIRKQHLDRCNKYLTETLKNRSNLTQNLFKTRCLRYLKLIENTIDVSEKQGIGDLEIHLRPDKELITVIIINNMNIPVLISPQVEIIFDLNSTCFDLILEVAKTFKVPPEIVSLEKTAAWWGEFINLNHKSGKTLKDLKFVHKQKLNAKRIIPSSTQLQKLFQANGSINPLAKNIFISFFNEFSENDKMSPEQLAMFNHSCTGDNCVPNERRVRDIFLQFDKDRDGFLIVEDFLEFYHYACIKYPAIVWGNLISHNYTSDFKKFDQIKLEKVDKTSLLRYVISTNNCYFQNIYSLLDLLEEEEINIMALNLLNRLPTSPNMLIEIVKSWNTFLDINSRAKLVYSLQIIGLLTKDHINDKRVTQIKDILLAQDPTILEKIKNWKCDFIKDKGVDHLLNIIQSISTKFKSGVNIIDSRVLSNCLKILVNYLKPLLEASSVVENNKNVSLMRLLDEALIFLQKKMDLYQENGSCEVSNVEAEEMEKLKNLSTRLGNELGLEISMSPEITYILDAAIRLWHCVFADPKNIF